MLKNIVQIGTLIMINCVGVYSQNQGKGWIGMETDPISTSFGAKTISTVVEPTRPSHWSLFINVVNADFPSWMDDMLNPHNKEKGFDTRIKIGGGNGIDYFIDENRKGLYFGIINLFFQNEINLNNKTKTLVTHNIIPRIGYRWYPLSKTSLYINPFLGMRYEYSLQEHAIIDGLEFVPAGVQPFGTVHLGYHF